MEIKEFIQAARKDSELISEFNECEKLEDVLEFCARHGVETTEEELKEAVVSMKMEKDELSDEELEMIAGGKLSNKSQQELSFALAGSCFFY